MVSHAAECESITTMNISRRSALSAMAALSLPAVADSRVPVLVELFTSEGCSSCPPADLLLSVLDEKQPIPGAEVIAVSEHVDYWNYIGWTDPFSSAVYSRRQQEYSRRLRLESVYTPQMVVDGGSQFVGSDERLATEAITRAAHVPKIGITLEREGDQLMIRAAIAFTADTSVFVAFVLEHAVSKVARGENRGRELRHVNVTSALVQAGLVQKGRTANLRSDVRRLSPTVKE